MMCVKQNGLIQHFLLTSFNILAKMFGVYKYFV